MLLLAACGDGGEQTSRSRDGGSEASSAELRQIEIAVEDLDARIARLEAATEELLELLNDEAALLRDLPELIEDLQRRRALLAAAADGLLGGVLAPTSRSTFLDTLGIEEEEWIFHAASTGLKRPSTTTAWWPTRGCCCRPRSKVEQSMTTRIPAG